MKTAIVSPCAEKHDNDSVKHVKYFKLKNRDSIGRWKKTWDYITHYKCDALLKQREMDIINYVEGRLGSAPKKLAW